MCKYKKYRGTAKGRFREYKSRANVKDFKFDLTFDQLYKLITGKCHYCLKEADPFQGIDRKDNTKGYVKTNCVGCCSDCNYSKRFMSETVYKKYLEKVTLAQIKKRPSLRKKVLELLEELG